ncbi:alpha/beta fold hydrolase [Sphingomonas immobilis]|uniref:Alpha/beta fold hydrolase n=1 Tax=Sphingomonas immobilis TaxID=3063997 RepID=A0ABT9A0N5_9SPHN|nr:alpha/beta fold hydrolase [Sphingomonas sp. CA1-15]MDO7843384.1 alpha/beta fold hydrolase [Sphingomonas sp. CA1-15]
MTIVTLPGGETIWYKTTGTGRPLLQIHGSAFGHKNFAAMTPLMAEHFQTIDFDLPGYGESRGAPRPGGMEGLAEVVYEFIVAAGFEKVSIHGTSFGAMIGLTLAARHPEVVDRLILSCFMARYDLAARLMRSTWKQAARDSGMRAVSDLTSVAGFARSYYERPEADAQLDAMREAFSKTDPAAFIAGTETIERTDLADCVAKIVAPTLMIAGAEDNMTPFRPGESGLGMSKIAEMIPGVECHVIQDCGHYLVLEQPELARDFITAFMAR